jgi:phosphonate degradation associated HDIG domain protein
VSGVVASSVDEVIELYERWGRERYDEALSQLDHALQTAVLAVRSDAPDSLVAAALLHDVGHLLDLAAGDGRRATGDDDLHHEAVGARYLSGLFGAPVTGPVALHVRAKRYRCAVDPDYAAGLSDGSTRSLELQGGPADQLEVKRFERNAGAADALALREWDDLGKVDGIEVPPLEHYRPLLDRISAT